MKLLTWTKAEIGCYWHAGPYSITTESGGGEPPAYVLYYGREKLGTRYAGRTDCEQIAERHAAEHCVTRVIFRRWNDLGRFGIVAILLDVPANPGRVMAFEHVGQHAEGTYPALMGNTRPATPEEYAALKKELESPPYNYVLLLRKRRSIQGGINSNWRRHYRVKEARRV